MITGEQVKEGRKLLGWSQEDLATAAAVSVSAIRNFESEKSKPHHDTLDLVRRALETAGVAFVEDASGGPRVRLR